MAKFSSAKRAAATRGSRGVSKTVSTTPDALTYEGGLGYLREDRSELFALGVTNFVGEAAFYESAESRDTRYIRLARRVAISDPEWFAHFVKWLRSEGNMRSAPLVTAAEGVHARLQQLRCATDGCSEYGRFVEGDRRSCGAHRGAKATEDLTSHKMIIASVLQRADEPSELIAYWEQTFGVDRDGGKPGKRLSLPKPVKRGIEYAISLAPRPLYNEYAAYKYDTKGNGKRFGDIIELVHPRSGDLIPDGLFEWLLDRRDGRDEGKEYEHLQMLAQRRYLEAIPQEKRREALALSLDKGDVVGPLTRAGVTWEWLASWLGESLDATFWEAVIPMMGYMALLRNLRNFDEAGISAKTAQAVAQKLADPAQVASSRQLTYRFWNAYKATDSLTYAPALEKALELSTKNIPRLTGKTLVLIDTSASMESTVSMRSTTTRAEAAAVFAIALAKTCTHVDLFGFGTLPYPHPIKRNASVLREVERFVRRGAVGGHGTNVATAIQEGFDGHDRVFVFTDMQTVGDVSNSAPANIPIYAFDLSGEAISMLPSSPNRYQIGGLTDATFREVAYLEAGRVGVWPWESASE